MNEYLGKAVVDGELRFASVSAVKLFDWNTKGGCARRWAFKYLFGKKEEIGERQQEAIDKGIALDKELKHYLATGEKNLSPLALKGLHILELPGPGLGLDVKLHTVEKHDGFPRVSSLLTAAGVPFVGELDVMHVRGHFRDDDGEFYPDPPNTVEVGDIKYKSNAKDRKGNSLLFLPTDLVRDIQMAGYGEWVGRVRPNTEHVRLSHLYFPAKPAGVLPTKVTRLHVIDDCRRTWEYVEGVVANMKDIAQETDIEKVPGNTGACDEYAGCAHREYCTAYRRNSLDTLYGKIATDFKETAVGLLSNNPQFMNTPMQQQLAAEEERFRAQVAQQQTPNEALAQVCTRLGAYGFGMPALGGNAAAAYAAMGGQQVPPGFVYQGIAAPPGAKRSLHSIQLTEVQHIYQLEGELAAERAGTAPAPTPAPTPAPVPAPPMPMPTQLTATSILPPGAPESIPALAMERAPADILAPTGMQPAAMQYGGAPAKPRGRPKKDASTPAPEIAAAPPAAQTAVAPTHATPAGPPPAQSATTQVTPVQVSTSSTGMPSTGMPSDAPRAIGTVSGCVLVNARFADKQTKSLAGYVDYINAELAKRYSVTADGKPGIQDVRCAPKDSPLAFGGWKGAVREVVKADPPAEALYHLDTYLDELNEVVADALRVVAEQKGWLFIRGVRS